MTTTGARVCPVCERTYLTGETTCPLDGALLVAAWSRDPLIGRRLAGKFEVTGLLGTGGFGTVYIAIQHPIDRSVALKVLRAERTNPSGVRRFLREAKMASQVSHPNIATVYDFGQADDGTLYLAMQLVEGDSLGRIVSKGPLSPARVVAIGVQLCDALDAVHRQGLVHRDIKPDNIMVSKDPRGADHVKLVDFGIARGGSDQLSTLTGRGNFIGTPAFASPEQIRGREVDGRSDIYSLGIVLYTCLAGARPFEGDSLAVQLQQVTDLPEPLPPTVPELLGELVLCTLAKDPERRPQTPTALRSGLLHALTAAANEVTHSEISSASIDSAESPTVPVRSAPRWIVAAIAAAVVAVFAVTTWRGFGEHLGASLPSAGPAQVAGDDERQRPVVVTPPVTGPPRKTQRPEPVGAKATAQRPAREPAQRTAEPKSAGLRQPLVRSSEADRPGEFDEAATDPKAHPNVSSSGAPPPQTPEPIQSPTVIPRRDKPKRPASAADDVGTPSRDRVKAKPRPVKRTIRRPRPARTAAKATPVAPESAANRKPTPAAPPKPTPVASPLSPPVAITPEPEGTSPDGGPTKPADPTSDKIDILTD